MSVNELDLGSLADQVAARARSRAEKRGHILTLPIPGFEDLFAVQYRRLTFEEKADLIGRHDVLAGKTVERVQAAADMLINGCQDVLKVTGTDATGKPTYQSLGARLTSSLISRLFELDPVPATARDALLTALDSEDLMNHFESYMKQINALDKEDLTVLPGESAPSQEG